MKLHVHWNVGFTQDIPLKKHQEFVNFISIFLFGQVFRKSFQYGTNHTDSKSILWGVFDISGVKIVRIIACIEEYVEDFEYKK